MGGVPSVTRNRRNPPPSGSRHCRTRLSRPRRRAGPGMKGIGPLATRSLRSSPRVRFGRVCRLARGGWPSVPEDLAATGSMRSAAVEDVVSRPRPNTKPSSPPSDRRVQRARARERRLVFCRQRASKSPITKPKTKLHGLRPARSHRGLASRSLAGGVEIPSRRRRPRWLSREIACSVSPPA